MPHPEHAVEELTGAGTDGLGFFTTLAGGRLRSEPCSRLFRRVAVTEAVTWALLLTGMFLKYVTETTELGVRVFGMVHGVVFIAYCLTTVVVAVDQRWSVGRPCSAWLRAVPPFLTVLVRPVRREARRARRPLAADVQPTGAAGVERAVAWLLRNPLRGAARRAWSLSPRSPASRCWSARPPADRLEVTCADLARSGARPRSGAPDDAGGSERRRGVWHAARSPVVRRRRRWPDAAACRVWRR